MRKLLTTTILLIAFMPMFAVNIWVSPDGNDQNDGTKENPYKTIMMAQRKARELRRLNDDSVKEGINILIADGTYFIDEPLRFRPEDSGSETSVTTLKGANGAFPLISGGVKVTRWEKAGKVKGFANAGRNLWVADVPRKAGRRVEFRQMWVDGIKTQRASNLDDGELDRILVADHENEVFWIPLPDVNINETQQLEMVIHQWWAIANLRVKNVEIVGDSAKVTLYQPESRIEFEHPWPAPFIDSENEYSGNSAFYFVNHPALLNNPGEWYADTDNGKIYYWPRKGENMKKAEVIVPFLETLVSIEGTLDNPVEYLNFVNISFEHTTWMRPSERGHVPLQAGFYILDAYKLKEPGTPDKASLENQAWLGRQPAGIELRNAQNNRIFRCKVQHMAATGIDLVTGTAYNEIKACKIKDIGGTGIQAGFFGDAAFEAHLPYNPIDGREVCRFETISNNLITNVTNEDWGCVGISVGFAHDINIVHNEVSHLNYSGICVGWGWTKTINCMRNNRVHANYIHHFARNMYDVGGVYTLSAQPNGEISENRIEKLLKAPYAHIPEHYQYIYYDEGSSYIRSIDNWTEKDKFFSNTPGPGNKWDNNGPDVSDEIKNKAGIQPEFQW
jgi:hypothetical protein